MSFYLLTDYFMFFDERQEADAAGTTPIAMETSGDPEIATHGDKSVQRRATPTREELEALTFDSREALLAKLVELGIQEEILKKVEEKDEDGKPRWFYRFEDESLTVPLDDTHGTKGRLSDEAIDSILERLSQQNA